MDPKQHGFFFTKITGTVPLFNGHIPFFTYHANGPLVGRAPVGRIRRLHVFDSLRGPRFFLLPPVVSHLLSKPKA